jgi:hypothetical protein
MIRICRGEALKEPSRCEQLRARQDAVAGDGSLSHAHHSRIREHAAGTGGKGIA